MQKGNIFLNIYTAVFFVAFAGCLYTLHVSSIYSESFSLLFGVAISICYLVLGVGVLVRKEWWYYLFKAFLYILMLAIPIGTLISYLSLKYMAKSNIRKQFTK